MFRADQEAELASIMRTRNAQIGVQPATIDVQLDGQIVCQKGRNEGLESKKKECKVKGTKVEWCSAHGLLPSSIRADRGTRTPLSRSRAGGCLNSSG